MKHVHQLVGDFGIEKNTLTDFLKREIELNYCPNFLDLSCDEDYIAVAGTVNSKPSITIYHVESLISQVNYCHLIYILYSMQRDNLREQVIINQIASKIVHPYYGAPAKVQSSTPLHCYTQWGKFNLGTACALSLHGV